MWIRFSVAKVRKIYLKEGDSSFKRIQLDLYYYKIQVILS